MRNPYITGHKRTGPTTAELMPGTGFDDEEWWDRVYSSTLVTPEEWHKDVCREDRSDIHVSLVRMETEGEGVAFLLLVMNSLRDKYFPFWELKYPSDLG